jgi:hypothetical protein
MSTFDSARGPRTLDEYRGNLVVLVYEGRAHFRGNAALKRELEALERELGRVRVQAVGDVLEFASIPAARAMVRATIAGLSRTVGLDVWLDWDGVLARDPYQLEHGVPQVLLLDGEGRELLRFRGELDARDRARLIAEVRRNAQHVRAA